MVSKQAEKDQKSPFARDTPQALLKQAWDARKPYISSTVAESLSGSPLVPVTPQFCCSVKGHSVANSTLLGEYPCLQHGEKGPHLSSNMHNTPGQSK